MLEAEISSYVLLDEKPEEKISSFFGRDLSLELDSLVLFLFFHIIFFSIKKILFSNFVINFLRKLFIHELTNKDIVVNPKKWNYSLIADNNAVSISKLLHNHKCLTITPNCLR